jgi:hypothetical protein
MWINYTTLDMWKSLDRTNCHIWQMWQLALLGSPLLPGGQRSVLNPGKERASQVSAIIATRDIS